MVGRLLHDAREDQAADFNGFAFSPRSVLPVCVLKTIRRAESVELVAMFFVLGAALGMWLVPLSTVLDAHGLHALKPFAFAANGLAAFVSPLIFGALADRRASPVKVLRALSLANAAAMALASTSIQRHWNPWLVLGLIQLHALCSSPAFSISSTIVFARLADAKKEFGPIRAMATLGWMAGCWVVSAMNADQSALAGYSGAVTWLVVCAFTFFLAVLPTPQSTQHLAWHERLGLDALTLLKNRDHRVVFLTSALFTIPIAAFYPYTPAHLRELGLAHTSAWMSLGQVTEIIAMFGLGTLLVKWRLKWIFACGLALGVLRFALSAVNGMAWLLAGVVLHGCSYTLVYITAQIYVEQRVDAAWRARGQALFSLMTSGVGNLFGYLGSGWWFAVCARPAGTRWPTFWSGLAAAVAAVLAYFLIAYRGRGKRISTADERG